MRRARHSSNWTSFSPRWAQVPDGHEIVDLAAPSLIAGTGAHATAWHRIAPTYAAVMTTALHSRPPLRRYACGTVASK
jgi:hypothetical protein